MTSAFQIVDDGDSKSGHFHCWKLLGDDATRALAVQILQDNGGARYIDNCDVLGRVAFEANDRALKGLKVKLGAKLGIERKRRVVDANATADQMGPGFDGFGKSWPLGEGDSSVHGLHPSIEGSLVKYAYFN